jgi:triacylglycerol lipase
MPIIKRFFNIILFAAAANSVMLAAVFHSGPGLQVLLYAAAAAVILLISFFPARVGNAVFRLRSIKKGYELILLFSVTFLLNTAANIAFGILFVPALIKWWLLAVNIAVCLLGELALLLSGLSRVFLTSLQLGIKWRVLIFFFWWVPGFNVFLLRKVGRLLRNEYEFETVRNGLNETRKESAVCRTKYPLLLVHGVFFRDFRHFDYWGRIPKELKKNGAELYLGDQQSAASVRASADELARRIEQLVSETGCEKVNIIAHSKGGLDARYAVSRLGMDRYVASLTTVCTPHRGCLFADNLLKKAPEKLKNGIAKKYNAALGRLGDESPDFIAAVTDLTSESCKRLNEEAPDMDGVYYQSVASKMNAWTSGKFPLNLSHLYVRPFDGENDGLVSVESSRWGENFSLVSVNGPRGVSHGDMIDLNRENIDGFDVREFYVDLVRGLKAMSL